MEVIITSVGPDNVGLADPIIHDVAMRGANIAEIQMYDHDEAAVFAMLCRLQISQDHFLELRDAMVQVAEKTGLQIRVWSPEERAISPRVAICGTWLEHSPRALLASMASGEVPATPAVIVSNRKKLQRLAAEFNVPFRHIGNSDGSANDQQMVDVFDECEIDYVVLARYMRVLPPEICWKFAGGRIMNLHHGLLPSFPGLKPYHDAAAARMLTFGATCHFIVPDLDAGNQTINQRAFSVLPGADIDSIVEFGQSENEPVCLVEGVRRVVQREVRLHFHKVVSTCVSERSG